MYKLMAIFRIDKITKTFQQRQVVSALAPISLTINQGDFIVVLGPSGCGKTTFLRLLAGLNFPTTGQVFYKGSKIIAPCPKRGYLFQEPRLFPWLTIRENLALTNSVSTVNILAEKLGLANFLNAYPHQLSGGMAKRAALARALTNDSEVLLLDEPLANLDLSTKWALQKELLKIWDGSLTCIMVTHDVDEALALANRIIIFTSRPGQIFKDIQIDLDYPRDSLSMKYIKWRSKIISWSMEAIENENK